MAGFASAIGGLGNAALQYGEGQRNRMLQEWGIRQSHLAQLIGQARDAATTPERQTELSALQSKILSAKPGEDPTKLLQDIQNHLTIHPVAQQAMQPPAPPKPQPGPAGPGETPGTGTLTNMIGGAAQPSSSPVQPSQQQPNFSPVGGFSPVSQPQAAAPAPMAQAQAQAPPQVPPIAAPQLNPVMEAYHHALQAGSMPPALRQAAEPFLSNEAALSHQKEMDNYLLNELGPHRLAAIKASVPEWDQLPSYIKAQYAAATMGVQAPSMQGMASAMYTPIHLTGIRTEDFARQFPEAFQASGIDASKVPTLDVTINKITGKPELIEGKGLALHFMSDGNGNIIGVNPVNPTIPPVSTPGVAPSLVAPIKEPTAGGGVELTSAHQLQNGVAPTAIPGAVSPSTLPTVTDSQRSIQTVDANGNQITRLEPVRSVRTHGSAGGVPPIAPPATPSAGSGGSATPTGASGVKEFPKFSEYQLTAQGQKDVSQIDEVLSQIKNLKQKFEEKNLSNDNSKSYYPDYFKYIHLGQYTPNQAIWTALSFESLRSAATALRGTNSRALPIITRALEHTPNPAATMGHAPDSPKNMYNKLVEMEKILTEGRQKVLEDEKKSGVVKPLAGRSVVDDLVNKYGH